MRRALPMMGVLAATAILNYGCSRKPQLQFDNSEVLWTTNHESIFVETWHPKVLFGQPIYMIFEQNETASNKQALFTVETEFQESVPGYPHIFMKDSEAFIRDATTSYVFSVMSRHFVTNAWVADVYLGSYTNKP
jgi:hypothetical protein